jgi:aminomethyltransferase
MKTPLYEQHLKAGARMGPFGGWEMPIQYAGILAEHAWTRDHCSLFDICHMGELEVSGPGAVRDLDRLITQSVATLKEGQCRYGYLLQEDGGVLDDLTCYRLGPERFYLVVNAATCDRDAEWIRQHLSDCSNFIDWSAETAKLDIQGPGSFEALQQLMPEGVPDLKYFRAVETQILDVPCLLSRTGYTGEWGYEIYFPSEAAVMCWDTVLSRTSARPAGLGARDTLRLEMGYPLYGHELSTERTPVAAAAGMFVDTSTNFIGREAVMRDLEAGTPQTLVGLELGTRRAARAHDMVMLDDQQVGIVTSGSLAPSLGRAVAMAYVDAPHADPGKQLDINARGRCLHAVVVDLPFYKNGTARRRPGKQAT